MRVLCLIAGILLLVATAAMCEDFEELAIRNAGTTRVLSGKSNVLKTIRVVSGGLQVLDPPAVELMIEIEVNGKRETLTPGDFDIKSIDKVTDGREVQTSIELRGTNPDLPLTVYVDYWCDPRLQYQQKSITIAPSKRPAGAVIKRVTIESMMFAKPIVALAPAAAGFSNDSKSGFAAVDPKSGKGVCFSFPSGRAEFVRGRSLIAYQEIDVPVEKGYKTGRLSMGAVSGTPEAAFAAYRQMVIETQYPVLAKNSRFAALRKQFARCFAGCGYLPPCSEDGRVDAQSHVADNKGFILLFNPDSAAKTVALPLSDAGLGLSGDLKISDWTTFESPASLGTKKSGERLEIEVPAGGFRMVGVNIDD